MRARRLEARRRKREGGVTVTERLHRSRDVDSKNTTGTHHRVKKTKGVRRAIHCFAVVGSISFLNHACGQHANLLPFQDFEESDVGLRQWQVGFLVRSVEVGEELCISYGVVEDEKEERNEPTGQGAPIRELRCVVCGR